MLYITDLDVLKRITIIWWQFRRVAAPTLDQGRGNIGIGVAGGLADHTSRTGTARAHSQPASHVFFILLKELGIFGFYCHGNEVLEHGLNVWRPHCDEWKPLDSRCVYVTRDVIVTAV